MKKILFDGLAIQSKKPGMFHGGSEYAKYIFKKAVDMGFHFDVVFSKQLFTSSEIENYIQQKDIVNVILVENKSGVYHVIDNGSYDCFFSALPYIYTNYSCKTPLFGVIHGLRSIELPWDKYRYKYFYENHLSKAGQLLIDKVMQDSPVLTYKSLYKTYNSFKLITLSLDEAAKTFTKLDEYGVSVDQVAQQFTGISAYKAVD